MVELHNYMCCMLNRFSHVWPFEIPWTIACKGPLSMGFPRQSLEWLATASSRGSSPPRDQTHISTHWQSGSLVYYKCHLWRWEWHPPPVLLPGKPHGPRSLVGCSPWGREESDTTERLHFHFSFFAISLKKFFAGKLFFIYLLFMLTCNQFNYFK